MSTPPVLQPAGDPAASPESPPSPVPASSQPSLLLNALALIAILAFTFLLPRVLLGTLGEENPWTSHWYLYGNGGLFFLIGIILILKGGACQLGRGRDSFWFGVLIFGYVFYVLLHTAWILAALHLPFKGGI